MDVSKLTVFGNVWDQFNVEQYAAFAPEVLITTTFDSAGTLWYVPAASASKIAKLAPSVAVSVYDRQLTQPLERVWALAESLGADLATLDLRLSRASGPRCSYRVPGSSP